MFDPAGFLVELKHCSGDNVRIENRPVSTAYSMSDNHSDWLASFILRPLPAIKCHQFFKASATGPYRAPALTSNSKLWSDLVAQAHSEWEAAQKAAAATQGGVDQEAALQSPRSRKNGSRTRPRLRDSQRPRRSCGSARRTFTLQEGAAPATPAE